MDNYDNLVIFMIRFQISIAINFLNIMLKPPHEQMSKINFWQHNTLFYLRVKLKPASGIPVSVKLKVTTLL